MAAKAKSIAEFRSAHDKNFIIPERYRKGITALGVSGWEYEGVFYKGNQISVTHGAQFREEFKDFIVEADGKRVICGSKKLATKLRGMV